MTSAPGLPPADLLPVQRRATPAFRVATQVPVVPVALSGMKDLWLGKPVRVVIGEPIPPGQAVDALVVEAEHRMAAMVPAYSDPGGRKLLRHRLTHLF